MNHMNEPIEIPISKTKLTVLVIGAFAFIIAGFFFALKPSNFVSRIFRNEQIIRIAGIASVVFFGICFFWILRKFFDDKIGLRIDETGIIDNSSGVSVGLIDWNDITGVETYQVYSTKFVVLFTDQPKKYIEKASNVLMKKAMQANNKMCGSPLTINSNALKIRHQELEKLILEKWNDHGKKDALQHSV
jgi:hypothetical protein